MKKRKKSRWAAKLLFQYRVLRNGRSLKRRVCEERIVVFDSSSAGQAYRHAEKLGRSDRRSYRNNAGEPVMFEFVGIMDLLELGIETEPGEAWYEITERLRPMERRKALIPRRSVLLRGPRRTHSGRQGRNLMFPLIVNQAREA